MKKVGKHTHYFMKSVVLVFVILLISINGVFADEQVSSDEIYADVGDVVFDEDPGMTPSNPFYFMDDFFDRFFAGDDPEKLLALKEEKIAEVREMIKNGDVENAQRAFTRVEQFSEILEREVSPEIEREARASSKAVKDLLDSLESDLEGSEWDDIRQSLHEQREREDKIALAAKISTNIKVLCESLAEIDPIEYEKVCRADDDAPAWQKQLDEKLTNDQKQDAEEFFEIMSSCFENPRECECERVKIQAFAEKCSVIAPLAADCEDGDEEACKKMDEVEDPIEVLPDYLKDVMQEVERKYNDDKHDFHMPQECEEAGATQRHECEEVMFRLHAPPECVEALDKGDFSFEGEGEAHRECERVLFETYPPHECVEEGIKDHKECLRHLFELYAPEECLDAGFDGDSRVDERRCMDIVDRSRREQGGEPQGGLHGAHCSSIEDPTERLACFDGALQDVHAGHESDIHDLPIECQEKEAFTMEECDRVMQEFADHEQEHFEQQQRALEEQFESHEERERMLREMEEDLDRRMREFEEYSHRDDEEHHEPEDDHHHEDVSDREHEEDDDTTEDHDDHFDETDDDLEEDQHEDTEDDTINDDQPDSHDDDPDDVDQHEDSDESEEDQEEDEQETDSPDESDDNGSDNLITGEVVGIDNPFWDYFFR